MEVATARRSRDKAMRARRMLARNLLENQRGGNVRNKKIRYAVVGLGHIAQTAVLPAFKHAENSKLAAIVTGSREKDRELSERYRIKTRKSPF